MPTAAKKPKRAFRPTRRTADRHDLYERAVQAPEADVRLLTDLYRRLCGEKLRVLREDFCGTAALAATFVAGDRDRRAIGVDYHAPTVRYAERVRLARLAPEERARVTLHCADVRAVNETADCLAALNFSWQIFDTREALHAYFRHAARCVKPGGLLVADIWGGSETQLERFTRRRLTGFDYVWETKSFDPITQKADQRIHFEFKDGGVWKNAFRYQWRIWSIPDLREAMLAAGLEDVVVLWEGTDRHGGGDGVFRIVERGEACQSFVAYLAARRPAKRRGAKATPIPTR
jgi:SAM-dependent methyltransferase